MLKKLIFSAFAMCFALSAHAQIATPRLNSSFHSYSSAAAGWRYNSNISLMGVSAEGKNKHNGTETGDAKAGMSGEGPDGDSSLPFLSAAVRGETFTAELYTNLTNGGMLDVEMDLFGNPSFHTFNNYHEKKVQSLNLAYMISEDTSVGFGYSNTNIRSKIELIGSTYVWQELTDTTTTKLNLSASMRMGEIFFVAAGLESVSEKGKFEAYNSFLGGVYTDGDVAANSWTNTVLGLGLMSGDPDDVQFRLEYSMVSSPESVKKAGGGEIDSDHAATSISYAELEAKFGDFLVAYQNEVEVEKELNNSEKKNVTTMVGIGWHPMEGMMVSVYSWEKTYTLDDTDANNGLGEIDYMPKGYRVAIGYNF